jgi:hypothetical protein
VFAFGGKVRFQALAKIARFDAHNVVLPRIVIGLPIEDICCELLLANAVELFINCAICYIEKELAETWRSLESGAIGNLSSNSFFSLIPTASIPIFQAHPYSIIYRRISVCITASFPGKDSTRSGREQGLPSL